MAKFVPTYKPDTIDVRADIVGSVTGGMFLVSFVVKVFDHYHATISVFCHISVSGK
jgi:hypothetical protein